ncbi:MAG: hypothetical protein IJH32_11275 [Ruminococcus sp.]|nr:hypothetical protein [Ruminococcus sp.]
MKRILLSLLSIALICALLCSCSMLDELLQDDDVAAIGKDDPEKYVAIDRYVFTVSPYYMPVENRASYYLLETEAERVLYEKLVQSAYSIYPEPYAEGYYNCEQAALEGALLSEAQIRVVIKAIYDDHPEIFWITSTFGYVIDKGRDCTVVQLHSDFSPADVSVAVDEVGALVDEYLADLPDGLSVYERELKVHDDIIDMCQYQLEAASAGTSDGYEKYYTVYGVLKENYAVCEGYARTFELLMNLLGVDCVGITGMAGGEDKEEELHMWNAVKLSGDWYLVDATWDDQEDTFQRHDYFNVSTEIMNLDHTPSKLFSELSDEEINGDETYSAVAMNMFVPECTQMAYNYIVREYPHLKDYDAEDVIDALYDAAAAQETYFEFYVDQNYLDLNEAINVLFADSPQYFFDYADTVNSWLSSYMIDTSSISYVSDPVLSYIVVELKYL